MAEPQQRLPFLLLVVLVLLPMLPRHALALLRPSLLRPTPARAPPVPQPLQRRAFRATPTCGLKIDIHIRGKRTGGEVRM